MKDKELRKLIGIKANKLSQLNLTQPYVAEDGSSLPQSN